MPIPEGAARVVLSGTAPNSEIFETGFWVAATNLTTRTNTQAFAAAVQTSMQSTAFAGLVPLISSDTRYTSLKVYSYPSGGPTATYVGEAPIVSMVGTGSGAAPLYQCIVLSLRTGISGRSFRGRMYLPATGTALTSAHRLPTAPVAAAVLGVGNWFNAINAFTGDLTASVSVVSQHLTEHFDVNEVTGDDKPDVQRRRENKMDRGTVASKIVVP